MSKTTPSDLTNEADRLAALRSLEVDTGATDSTLDSLVEIAARLMSAPIALVSLVEEHQQIFAARVGLQACSTSREVSFCSHAVASRRPLVVKDASKDPRFAQNPLVTGEPGIRFYAGAPMVTRTGHVVGAVCIIDVAPRPALDTGQLRLLTGLADLAVAHLERVRLSYANRAAIRLASTTPDALITGDASGLIVFWNAAAERIFGFSRAEAVGAPLEMIVPEEQRAAHRLGLERIAGGRSPKLRGAVEMQARRKSGERFPVEMSLAHWRDEGGVQFAAVVRDMSERRREQADLHRLARFDRLTGLPNRVTFLQTIDALTKEGRPYSVLKIGLDRFKTVNESLGLEAGDAVLCETARRVVLSAGPEAVTARLGGDEFGLVLKDADDPLQATLVAERVIAALSEPHAPEGGSARLSASVGVVLSPGMARPTDAHDALQRALLALQEAKREGGGRRVLYSTRMSQHADERQRLEEALRGAVLKGEFEVHYQPQVRLQDGVLVGAEALLRWRRPGYGLVAPAAFLLHLERSELSLEVGRWVLEQACGLGARMQADGTPLRIGVNLFSGQLRSPDFQREVEAALAISGLRPELLELEITETTVLGADEAALAPLRELRRQGVCIAFDDYGTGYASLSLLKRYPISRLKIDREFVTNLERDQADASIVRAVLAMGDSLGLEVIAEGVETAAQAALLESMGCSEAQGFHYGGAMPAHRLHLLAQVDRAIEPPSSADPAATEPLVRSEERHAEDFDLLPASGRSLCPEERAARRR